MTLTACPPALFLMGPTASGKTALCEKLVQAFDCEIISVDSAQIYKHLNIGTAKPDPDFLRRAPHHLIDIIEPDTAYSVAQFREDTLKLVTAIAARGRIPLLAGGTMMYFKSLIEGLNDLPAADPSTRAKIDAMALTQGWPGVHKTLHEVDPVTALRLAPNDQQRIQRALEIYLLTGKPLSEHLQSPRVNPFTFKPIQIALNPSVRSVLHKRIQSRFDEMLGCGLIDEVVGLRQRYPLLNAQMPSMRCVGYRQVWQYLDGNIDKITLREQSIVATRQLAKRQMTWLRSLQNNPLNRLASFDCLDERLTDQVIRHVQQLLKA